MATLPEADVLIDDEGGAFSGSTGYIAVFACAAQNADLTPRVFSSAKSLLSQHGYSKGVSYCASHFEETGSPVIFIGLPKSTAGYIGSNSHVRAGTGTCVITVAAGSNGIVDDADVTLTFTSGGTIGTNGIVFTISLDGGRTTKTVRLGTANSYTEPYHGFVISFAAGTLDTGDVYSFQTFAPMWTSSDLTTARTALAGQLKSVRSFLVTEDVPNSTFAGNVVTETNAYATSNDRFVYSRVSVLPKSRGRKSKISSETLTFAEVGVTGDTITRSAGSWLADGFRVGDSFTITGTVSNNISGVIGALSATVMTLTTADLVAETIASNLVSIVASDTKAAHVSAQDAAFASIDGQRRIDLSIGQGFKQCPVTGWLMKRPASWGASLREYQHDVHIPCWRKADGPLTGFSLEDTNGNISEFDERIDGGALAARFTCFRTYSNGPRGTFVALSLTRGSEGSLLSRTHNMAVANVACTIAQLETENAIGQVLVLKSDGTGTEASLALIEERVNSALQINLLQDKGEGQRASSAVWRASRSDVLNVPGATLIGTLTLLLNGTLEKIVTRVKVQTAG